MFKVYILQSLKTNRHYIGRTTDLENRLTYHNGAKVKATKGSIPWKVIYTETYNTKSEAHRREFEIKIYKGGIKFKKLLGLPI